MKRLPLRIVLDAAAIECSPSTSSPGASTPTLESPSAPLDPMPAGSPSDSALPSAS